MSAYDEVAHLHPCEEAIYWLKTQPNSQTAWNSCQRSDWMLWYLRNQNIQIPKEIYVAITIDVAETVMKFVPKKEPRPRKAVETAKKWLEDPTEENRRAAAAAADAAYADADDAAAAVYATAAYAADAAYAAARAAAYAADADDAAAAVYAAAAARAAAYAAYAAANAAAYAAAYAAATRAATDAARAEQADVIRKHIPTPFSFLAPEE